VGGQSAEMEMKSVGMCVCVFKVCMCVSNQQLLWGEGVGKGNRTIHNWEGELVGKFWLMENLIWILTKWFEGCQEDKVIF